MSLRLPALDDRSYTDLVAEARALIPALDPEWTNHNATDPGITLIELFAWLTEMLIYRVDRLPREHVRTFLRLLNGPGWVPGPDLDEDIRITVTDLRQRHRAVTAADYELLARDASPSVIRARAVPLRDLSAATEEARKKARAGQVSLIVVPGTRHPDGSISPADPDDPAVTDPSAQPGAPLPSAALLAAVAAYLEPRRLLTVRHFVVGPVYAPVQAEIVLARRQDVPEDLLRGRIRDALAAFLDPLTGGPDGEGWPFGRDVYVSEIYQLLEAIPGIDYVPDVTLSSTCPPGAPRCVAAAEIWHADGDLVGLGLGAHHLPWAQIDPEGIVVAAAFLPVRVRVEVVPSADSAETEAMKRKVKAALRRRLHPRHGGPDGQSAGTLLPADLRPVLLGLPGIAGVASLDIDGPEERIFTQNGEKGVRILVGELVDADIQVSGI